MEMWLASILLLMQPANCAYRSEVGVAVANSESIFVLIFAGDEYNSAKFRIPLGPIYVRYTGNVVPSNWRERGSGFFEFDVLSTRTVTDIDCQIIYDRIYVSLGDLPGEGIVDGQPARVGVLNEHAIEGVGRGVLWRGPPP